MKKKLLASALLACSLVTLGAVSVARAEPLPAGGVVLETVDSVTTVQPLGGSSSQPILRVEGIVRGESAAREFDLQFYLGFSTGAAVVQERCLKFMLLEQSHPGR